MKINKKQIWKKFKIHNFYVAYLNDTIIVINLLRYIVKL